MRLACSKNSFARTPCVRGDVAHGREHRDSAVLQLSLPPALKVLHGAVGGEASRVPETDGRLDTELVLEGTQGRGS
eukprot:3243443-Alexandrium_andersonii.AAC.1